MRRRRRPESAAPRVLVEYRAQDWLETACHPECAYWAAVEAWQAEHPDVDLELASAPDLPWHPELI